MMYRSDLPTPMPRSIRNLPVQDGLPVPWFTAKPSETYDLRIADAKKFRMAITEKRCWVCGDKITTKKVTFPIGCMCVINRTIAEPPSHYDCAAWSAKACPFLAQHQSQRRVGDLPTGLKEPGGIALKRQPGVTILWVTRKYELIEVPNGILFKLGSPSKVYWMRKGRAATRQECLDAIEEGYPSLLSMAQAEGREAVQLLEQCRDDALLLLPEN